MHSALRPRAAVAGVLLATLLAGGCATFDGPTRGAQLPVTANASAPGTSATASCTEAFARIDAAVAADDAGDGSARRIDGFPYLRVDRLLASFGDALATPAAERLWVDRLIALDRSARSVELANLGRARGERLAASLAELAPGETPTELVVRCGRVLREADDRDPARMVRLRERAVVPDDYSLLMRGLGVYPITSLGFARGIRGWQRETEAEFAAPIDDRVTRGILWSYSPASGDVLPAARVAELVRRAADNALGLPLPTGATLEALLRSFAPVYEVDTLTDDDRLGAPVLTAAGRPRIDTRRPTVYARAAATRVGDQTLLQLVYTAWFPARPRTGTFDLLGGPLDGLVWRVTLAPDGAPLVFDTIHPCGCYHMFFPRPGVEPRPSPAANEEFVFVPQRLPAMPPGTRAVLRIAARTHYLEHVAFAPAAARAVPYELASEDDLRSLSLDAGLRRSLYAPDGIVRSTERGERFLFWPMGIESAGAMRQWGRHATAFVGRRHFDDARLMEERFDFGGLAGPRTPPPGPRSR